MCGSVGRFRLTTGATSSTKGFGDLKEDEGTATQVSEEESVNGSEDLPR